MKEFSKKDIENLEKEIENISKSLDIQTKEKRVKELESQTGVKDFWGDQEKAKDILKEIEALKKIVEETQKLKQEISALLELSDGDTAGLEEDIKRLQTEIEDFKKYQFLSGEYDNSNAILSIHAGQGGTEANDWAEMLLRMYQRYCESQGWNVKVTNILKGSEVGISTATMKISGPYAFGLLKREHGTHRLVRLSPFNAQNLRQTSFAGVEVIPEVRKEDKDLDIPDKDIDFKAVRSGGPGGQKVNKTSSAVQITHIPTGIVVHSSEERSQVQNRENAMNILKAKLWRIKNEEQKEKIEDIKGEYKKASWGNQIRNYILHPYKLVKDLRTNVESSDPESVLDGNLTPFIEAEIRIQ
jgi:peptide chain release factor 2